MKIKWNLLGDNSTPSAKLLSVVGIGVALLGALMCGSNPSFAEGLSGKATFNGAPLEGVLVSAKKDGSTITTTVVTDANGNYAFPADRLAPGQYAISIRAVGYELDGPNSTDVPQGKTGSADIKLKKTEDLQAQLSNAEWLMSIPAADKDKAFLDSCTMCHSLQRIVNSTHTPEEFLDTFKRMALYATGSMPTKPQPLLPDPARERTRIDPAIAQKAAELLSKVNLSGSPTHNYELKTLPLPKGRSTKVIYTEYDLPANDWEPHDVIIDQQGMVWVSDFGDQRMGRMDPKTGKVQTIALPLMKDDGSAKGGLEIAAAPNGDIWESGMMQAGVWRWVRATGKVIAYKLPEKFQSPSAQISMVSPDHADVDGYVWLHETSHRELFRIKVATGELEDVGPEKDANGKPIPAYGIPTDLKNRPYLLENSNTRIGAYNPETKIAEVFATPTIGARPRRGRVDQYNRLWFAEFGGNGVGMFDPETKKITEYRMPTPYSSPYDAVATKSGSVWTGGMNSDYVQRLDPKTADVVEYLLPRPTNIRRVFADDKGPHEALWVGSNLGASIVKVEPLD